MHRVEKNLAIVSTIVFLLAIGTLAFYMIYTPWVLDAKLFHSNTEGGFITTTTLVALFFGGFALVLAFQKKENTIIIRKTKSQKMDASLFDSESQSFETEKLDKAIEAYEALESEEAEKAIKTLFHGACNGLQAVQGMLYVSAQDKDKRVIKMIDSYAITLPDSHSLSYEYGEGLAGQVAKEGKERTIKNIPDSYFDVASGLGKSKPRNVVLIPLKETDSTLGVIELAFFKVPASNQMEYFNEKFINAFVKEIKKIKD